MQTYSQDFEDIHLQRFFDSKYIGFYVDVGAYDPERFSNTALFYKKGWRGINIEPNKSAIEKFNQERCFDINLNLLIGKDGQSQCLYVFNEKALNTTNKKRASFLNTETTFKIESKINYKTVSLKNVFRQHLPPLHRIDFMSVDVETMELEVLKSNDWSLFRPTYLLVEMLQDDLMAVTQNPVTKFLAKKKYTPFAKIGRTTFFKNLKENNIFHCENNLFSKIFKKSKIQTAANQAKAKIIILVPFFNRKEKVAKVAAQLTQQSYQDFEAVFIDAGSTDGSAAEIRRFLPAAIILSGNDLWWAESLQWGYKYVRAKKPKTDSFVLILNEDTEFSQDFLSCGVEQIDKKRADLLGAVSIAKDSGKIEDSGVFWDWQKNICRCAASNEEINCLSTRGLLIRANVFIALNGFRPWLLPHYLSDYAYTIRAHRLGYRLSVSPDFHLTHQTEPLFPPNIAALNLFERCKILFSKKCKSNPFYYLLFIWIAYPNLKTKLRATRYHLRATRKMIVGDAEFLK